MLPSPQPLPSSFRDPSGFVFLYEGEVYRQVNTIFADDFDAFIQSGLYYAFVEKGRLIPHQNIPQNLTGRNDWATTLKPEQLPFVSYPYEWSFTMLKEAAELTLELAVESLAKGMILKDASPYNVQLYKGRMTFIDTLSFKRYADGEPWIAYRQFCESFVAPLALMHYAGLALPRLFLAYPDGIPLAVASKLLPFRSRLHLHLYLHVHLHAATAQKQSGKPETPPRFSKQKLLNVLKSLQTLVASFRAPGGETAWKNYYEEAETRTGYLDEKKAVVQSWLERLPESRSVIDIGGNRGEFSILAAAPGRRVVCADADPQAVERLYRHVKKEAIENLYPVCVDFTAPSPALGLNNAERASFFERASSGVAMALALVHHLAIGKNIPFTAIADMCARLGETLLIEFVQKDDEKAKLLLRQKNDIYDGYTQAAFEAAFGRRFALLEKRPLSSSPRVLYLMKRL